MNVGAAYCMRHNYVGDVGDFGKYGLLRSLHELAPNNRLGVLWYLTDEFEHTDDGRHDGYLSRGSSRYRKSFADCDPDLYHKMFKIRESGVLSLDRIQHGDVLPSSTTFFDDPVPARRSGKRVVAAEAWERRQQWHADAVQSLRAADYIFADPDNGVVFPGSVKSNDPMPSPKHAYWSELSAFLNGGKAVVAYHHLGRQRGGHVRNIKETISRISDLGYRCLAVHYRRGSARAFILIPAQIDQLDWFARTCRSFAAIWSQHCSIIESI